ncbi:WD40 repeat-like protein [Phellopilus nigrolimitatus]|nr:WD40 repeat-like protein [Phellopilus nigrolimitatus]
MVADTHALPVLFTTQTPHALPAQKFMIPAAWRRYQLSQLVNKALALAVPVPFDFLVRGELLRASLAEWCNARGVGTEETLEIEYIESLMPPQHVSSIPHDDWVASVSCQIPGHFVTAAYDGLVRVFDASLTLVHTIPGHSAPATSVCVVPRAPGSPPADADDTRILASASHDTTARLTALSLHARTSRTLATLHLHTAPLAAVAASASGAHLLTAGWDALVGLWDTAVPAADEVPAPAPEARAKRRRVGAVGADDATAAPRRKAPLAVLKSHTGRVTGAVFGADGAATAYSCSLDSTVRSWDVESGVCVHTLTAPEKPFLALALLGAPHLLAAASSDRSVGIYDTRALASAGAAAAAVPLVAALAHGGAPACLARSPANAHHVASGAYDGVVRVWDVRSVRGAVASFRAGGDAGGGAGAGAEKRGDGKVLGLDWVRGVLGVAGEAGLDVWRVPEERARVE